LFASSYQTVAGSGQNWIGHSIAEECIEKDANFRGCVNEKTRFKHAQTMKFLGLPNEIHSP
jgi:hypothetical protein